ncbi:MAG: hypothetical protein OES57_15970 [Acidimicrobiia bacterium]|nr:hypothetical protein [Acidimicrobiia bacterium]
MTGLTAEQTVDGVGRLLWLSQELAAALAAWDEPSDDAALRVWVAGARRRLATHIDEWRSQLPESVLLEPDARIRPGPGDEARLARLAGADDPGAFRAAANDVVEALVTVIDVLVAGAGPVADGALLRAGSAVRGDLVALAPPR